MFVKNVVVIDIGPSDVKGYGHCLAIYSVGRRDDFWCSLIEPLFDQSAEEYALLYRKVFLDTVHMIAGSDQT